MKMPASFAEFSDALQKARIKDGSFCKNELTCIHYNGLTHAMIGWNANLYDLNLFAQRLASLTEEQKKGMDALLKIKQNHRVAPIPLNQLINLTYNTDICCFAPRVSNHEELGAFLYANEMLSNEAMALLDTTEEGSGFQERLLELLGEQHQEDHGGVFTDFGYAELGGEIKDIYVCQSNETACFHRSDAPVVLEVRKGFFNDPSYDNDKTAVLNLPAADAGIWRAVEKVDAASVDECAFRCVDCLIPFLRDAINNAIDDEDGIEQADEFAKRLAQIEREWPESDMVKYKALLSVVDHPSLQDATRLMGEIDQYELRPEVAQTWGYAEMMFREKYSALPEELFQTPQAAQIGQKMLDDRLGVGFALYDEYVDEQIEASEVQSDLLPKSGKLVNLLSAYEELQQIPDEERITRLAPGAFGYCLDPNVPDERLHTAYQQALSALELESDEIQEAESFTSRDEIISRMRDCLLAKELTAGDKVLFVATEPYGGPGDFDLRGGVIESVDEKDKTCSVRGTFFTMEKVPLHYVLGRYNPAVGEEHYGVRGIVPFFCEDKELAGYYLNEVRTMWDVEMGEEQDLSM